MRQDYSSMTMNALVDLLAEETQKFTHLLTYKQYGKDYEESKKKIHEITTAINRQKEKTKGRHPYNPDPNS